MDSNVIDKMASEISKELDIPQELIANAMERHQPTEMKDEETISTDRYYSPIWEFINDVYKDITESNNNESLKESDLTRIVKQVIQRKIWVPTNK
jgi:phage-related tail protein